jgi:glycosyltransferase involved in cell wall biosynthesis
MKSGGDLVLLTAAFPFGNKSETFLEPEIEILARRFARILILPSRREAGVRPLPYNVSLIEMDWLRTASRAAKRRALLSPEAGRVLLTTFRSGGNWRPYAQALRTYADVLARNIMKFRSLLRLTYERRLERAVFYDYWFENSTLALALLRRSGAISAAVCRAHGFDVYDERWGGRRVPFREFKAAGLDVVFAVSSFAAHYLCEKTPALQGKLRVSRLGVREQPVVKAKCGSVPLVVSCGSLLPQKRVHLIPEVLARVGRPVRWVHLGDGPERAAVEAAASRLPEPIGWELRGHLNNRDVLRFYQDNDVAALVSLSISEGLPVSMMEAQSFGIPIVAVGVHGVPEIVNQTTGILLSPDSTTHGVASALALALQPGRFDRAGIRAFFRQHYEADTNYNSFADALVALQKNQASGT